MLLTNNFRPTYQWPEQTPELVEALAKRLRLTREEALSQGIDIEQVALAILDVFDQWRSSPRRPVDYELRAVLACALASRWLAEDDPEGQEAYTQMLAEMAQRPPPEAYESFSEMGVCTAVTNVLGCWVKEVRGIGTPVVSIVFQGGDYGRGVFDGIVQLDLYTRTLTMTDITTGKTQVFVGTDLPATDEELEDAVASDLWRDQPADHHHGADFGNSYGDVDEDALEPIDDTSCFTLRR